VITIPRPGGRLTALVVAMVAALSFVVLTTGQASAHSAAITPSCASISIDVDGYTSGGTVSGTAFGSPIAASFASSYHQVLTNPDQSVAQPFDIVVSAPDWPDYRLTSVIAPCVASTTTTTTTSTAPTTTVVTTSPSTVASPTVPATSVPQTISPTLRFDVLGPVCVGDLPYIHWTMSATGLRPDQTTATLTITDVNDSPVATLANQPFSGQVIWPGASAEPQDWPGWVRIGGVWYVDPSDAILRQGIKVTASITPSATAPTEGSRTRVEADPTLSGTVAYPDATAACAQPEDVQSGAQPPAPAAGLPATGHDLGGLTMGAALVTALGIALGLVARRRVRTSER
jgi:hypothetical protein